MAKSNRLRLDELLVLRGLAESRTQAKALVMAGRVKLGTERLDKPGRTLPIDSSNLTVDQPPQFVSRGGDKLDAFLKKFHLGVQGLHVLDVGASTGGFTDCVLQHGASDVVCIDVGRAQLHARLRADSRVTNLEQINARKLNPKDLPREKFELVVVDVSFISLRVVLPAIWPLVSKAGNLVALVKPQFEAGKRDVDRGRGVIRDAAVHNAVLQGVLSFCETDLPAARIIGAMDSPIKGADGNREFLIGVTKDEF
ncbi:MAG: TlyA family RNA methyltransferase [Opitutaceae bacterium]|nr:TlyA family RNA methyltransferase [Opitutaceae bacterium]